jgi:hypothetical protein
MVCQHVCKAVLCGLGYLSTLITAELEELLEVDALCGDLEPRN